MSIKLTHALLLGSCAVLTGLSDGAWSQDLPQRQQEPTPEPTPEPPPGPAPEEKPLPKVDVRTTQPVVRRPPVQTAQQPTAPRRPAPQTTPATPTTPPAPPPT